MPRALKDLAGQAARRLDDLQQSQASDEVLVAAEKRLDDYRHFLGLYP